MTKNLFRSTIFNICFYALTALSCVLLIPTLMLPRKAFLTVVKAFVHTTAFLEKYILGLTYEIRGLEYLPKAGSYIVSAKHQSAYETLKLHILFKDPAIVLKKELLQIPLWGSYLWKSDVIAIDRSSPKNAIKSMQDETKRVAAQGRPIIVFPQGTRVGPEITPREKPYKIGVFRMQEASGLPIIPLALNTAVFYPKHSWCKKPGKVIFEFLPPVMPSNEPDKILKELEMKTEEATSRLMEEGKSTMPQKSVKSIAVSVMSIILVTGLYVVNWQVAANITQKSANNFLDSIKKQPAVTKYELGSPKISGFPKKIEFSLDQQFIKTRNEEFAIEFIKAESWPIMGMPIDLKTGGITLFQEGWNEIVLFDSLEGQFAFKDEVLVISDATLLANNTELNVKGHMDFNALPYPVFDLEVNVKNLAPFITDLVRKNIIKQKQAMTLTFALQALQRDGVIKTSITTQKNKIYLGPIKIMEMPLHES